VRLRREGRSSRRRRVSATHIKLLYTSTEIPHKIITIMLFACIYIPLVARAPQNDLKKFARMFDQHTQ
jgi:hypothetical protein